MAGKDNEFKSRLLIANDMADKFFANCKTPNDLEQDKDVIECFLKAFDLTTPGSKEEKEFYFDISDFYLYKGIRLVSEIKKIAEERKRPVKPEELKEITDNIVCYLDDAIAQNDRNKAAYIQRKEEILAAFNSELAKHKIAVKKDGCYIATAVYGSYDCPQVWTLRRYRDSTLAKTIFGRTFIRIYYAISPIIVKWFGRTEWLNLCGRIMLDKFIVKLQGKGHVDTPYIDINQ
mgnify:CR=1 FL=1